MPFKKGDKSPTNKTVQTPDGRRNPLQIKALESSPAGFRAWLAYYEPRVLNSKRKWEIFTPTAHQEKLIDKFLVSRSGSRNKRFLYNLILNIEPRRHGKSTLFLLIVLWLFMTRENFTIQLLGNGEGHSRRTQFNRLVKVIENTPKLAGLVKDKKISNTRVDLTRFNRGKATSVIQGMTGLSTAGAFGDRINVLWVSDYHACPDNTIFNAWQASLLDSQDTVILVDSNVDGFGGPVHGLQEAAEIDPAMVAHHLFYENWTYYKKKAPKWIDRKKAQALEKTLLPDEFKRDILGVRTQSTNNLFSHEIIQGIQRDYTLPVSPEKVRELTAGREYYIGAGLDRAKNLIQTSKSDASVWAVVLKVQNPGREPEYITLNQTRFPVNTEKVIIAQILKDHEAYGLTNVCLENYETGGLYHRLVERGIPAELVTPNQATKNIAVPEFYRICSEGRFRASKNQDGLFKEMSGYIYERTANGSFKFSHGKSTGHDDHIDSTVWAVYSLRQHISSMFTLDAVNCENKGRGRQFCYLMGGDHILESCAMRCSAHHEVREMHQTYLRQQPDSDISLTEFFKNCVKTEVKQYQL